MARISPFFVVCWVLSSESLLIRTLTENLVTVISLQEDIYTISLFHSQKSRENQEFCKNYNRFLKMLERIPVYIS